MVIKLNNVIMGSFCRNSIFVYKEIWNFLNYYYDYYKKVFLEYDSCIFYLSIGY